MSAVALPLTFRRGGAPAHERIRARSERRRRLTQVQEKLQGDLIALGYFYADLQVGTPPQTFSLIVDTGSSVTAIPCAGCRQCGRHTNPRFQPDASATFQHASCGGSLYCTSCMRGVCGYRVSYQEGSSYSGYLARDVIRLGIGGACVSLEFPFGCSTEETGLFTSQQADGIMGLASSRRHRDQSNPTVLEALVARRLVDDVFSLCIGSARGTLTFGMPQVSGRQLGADGAGEPPSLFWTYVVESTYYGVDVRHVLLGPEALGPAWSATPSSAIVDSGTTFMYLHSAAFGPLLASVGAKRCAGLVTTAAPKDEFCVRVSDARLRLGKAGSLRGSAAGALFDGCYPPVEVVLAGGSIRMAPSQYFYASEEADEFCLGIFDNYEDSLVLGAINMMDHEVIFDRVRRRIGFYPRVCAEAAAQADDDDGAHDGALSASSLLAAANLSFARPPRLNASADPCAIVLQPSLVSALLRGAARLVPSRAAPPGAGALAALVLCGVLLGVVILEAHRRWQQWRPPPRDDAAAAAAGGGGVGLASLSRRGRPAEGSAELVAMGGEAGGGGGGAPPPHPFWQAMAAAPDRDGGKNLSDEEQDDANSEVCLLAR